MVQYSGWTFPPDLFRIHEKAGQVSESQLLGLVDQTIPAIHLTEAITTENCSSLVKHFKESPGTHPRGDGVPGDVLGAYHYSKTYEQYMMDLDSSETYVQDFLLSGGNPVQSIINSLQSALQSREMVIRPALWGDRPAATARALSWTSHGPFLLEPHEDMAQLSDPKQDGFEAQKVFGRTVIAVNLYPNVPSGGGKLRLWNLIPDNQMRALCGTLKTGYPYPTDALEDLASIELAPMTGSIIIMNGGLIHAVTGYEEGISPANPRLIINFFAGSIDDQTFVRWV